MNKIKKEQKKEYFNRFLLDVLKKWIDRKEIFAIKGPRQSGKTTLLKMLRDWLISQKKVKPENIIFITFEDKDILEEFSADPKSYVKSFIGEKTNEKFYFFIDEFHYLDQGGQVIKLLYDIFENIKFVITGSSSLELANQTGRYLVGRVFSFELWPLSFEEYIGLMSGHLANAYREKSKLLSKFIFEDKNFCFRKKDIFLKDFEKYFREYAVWGGYPAVIKSINQEEKRIILKNIYDSYISKDIIELLKITDYSSYKSLVRLLSARIGNLINYNDLAQDAHSYFKEIKQYLCILEETYIVYLSRPFFKNKSSELKKNPMVYFIDIGLRNYIIDSFKKISMRPDLGQIVENVVFSQLKFKQEDNYSIKYWRTLGKAEVDFILEKRNGTLIPIEVKYSCFDAPKISRSFRSFIEQYKPQKALVLTKGFWGEMKLGKTIIRFAPVWYI